MKIAITGAGGYIGRHVITELLNSGHTVIAADINTDDVDERASKLNIDIFSADENPYYAMKQPDVLLHLAWRDGFKHNSNAHMGDLSAHYKFLSSMIEGGLKHLVVMGTMHEIGYHEGAINDKTLCNPVSMYGIAKDALRRSIFQLTKEKQCILQWLRAYYIYGDDLKNNSIFAKLTATSLAGKTTFPFTTGKNKYDFISIEELAKQISAATTQSEVTGIINCCSGIPVSLAEKVESYIENNNMNIRLEYGAFPDRPYDSPCIYGNPDKIQKIMRNKLKELLIEYYEHSSLMDRSAQAISSEAGLAKKGESFYSEQLINKLSNSEVDLFKIAKLAIEYSKNHCASMLIPEPGSKKELSNQLINHDPNQCIQNEKRLIKKLEEFLNANGPNEPLGIYLG